MRKRITGIAAGIVAVAVLVVGGSAIASAQNNSTPKKPVAAKQHRAAKSHAALKAHRSNAAIRKSSENASESSSESSGESSSEADTDGAAQAAACQKAGVSGDNVNYDDQTGTCTADAGGDSGANN
jgi:hypothetical protein